MDWILANRTELVEIGRSAGHGQSCPPQTGFNAFAFLAFILLTIDTVMNILNNLNNNNNSNNNNDRNNNNNNMFESMNMSERRSFPWDSFLPKSVIEAQSMLASGSSPWDRGVFETLALHSGDEGKGLQVMQMWVASVLTTYPSCMLVIPCLAWQEMTDIHCPATKAACPLFTSLD